MFAIAILLTAMTHSTEGTLMSVDANSPRIMANVNRQFQTLDIAAFAEYGYMWFGAHRPGTPSSLMLLRAGYTDARPRRETIGAGWDRTDERRTP